MFTSGDILPWIWLFGICAAIGCSIMLWRHGPAVNRRAWTATLFPFLIAAIVAALDADTVNRQAGLVITLFIAVAALFVVALVSIFAGRGRV